MRSQNRLSILTIFAIIIFAVSVNAQSQNYFEYDDMLAFQTQKNNKSKSSSKKIIPKSKKSDQGKSKPGNTKQNVKPVNPPGSLTKRKNRTRNSMVKEEIQRYLGYETLLTRYFTLPYDLTMNNNVNGYYLDVGYLILMFLPVILLLGWKGRPYFGYLVMFISVILLLLATTNGVIVKNKVDRLPVNEESLKISSGDENIVDVVISKAYQLFEQITAPLNYLLDMVISGDSDYITYPLLTLFFLLLFFILENRLRNSDPVIRVLTFITILYMFLWFLLAAGIIWYGYLMMPMCILFIWAAMNKLSKSDIFNKIIYSAFIIMALIWIVNALVLRTSNIYTLGKSAGIHMFDNPIVKYQMGYKEANGKKWDKNAVIQSYFPGLSKNRALRKINSNHENLIYSAGSMFPYFIEKNDERLITDNLLGLFEKIKNKYRDKQTMARAFKASKIRFILINLQLHKIDKTPEKSVEKKFVQLMNFVYKNPQVKLLATDRQVKIEKDGQTIVDFAVFGDIIKTGTYAIYEIK